ncbi:MAG: hypothetical protein DA408_00330 [Bacteroidetes bacterium]|nr:MAG: hypothetical protein DA408_00330 [Bacteroidota bacterium]
MSEIDFPGITKGMEVNLKRLLEQVLQHKYLFLISIITCLGFAMAYIKLSTPVYEISTSLLIDPSGTSRQLGESKYMDGGVGMLEPDKNIFNEIGVIKSFGLIEQTVKALNFDVGYFAETNYKEQEYYGYFPFEVILDYSHPQIFDTPIYIAILSDSTYRLRVKANKFELSNPVNGTSRTIEKALDYTKTGTFGKPLSHSYFSFILRKPSYPVVLDEFSDKRLLFKVYSFKNVTDSYLSNLEVSQIDIQASILELSLKGTIVAKETDFLDKLVQNYIRGQLLERDEIAQNKEDFIRQQLFSIADSLAIAERSLENFRRNSRAIDLTQTGANALNQVQDLTSRKAQLEVSIRYYQSQLQTLQDSSAIDQILAPSVVGINDPLLNDNLLEIKRLYAERARLKFTKGQRSLDVELLNQQIKNSTNSLRENLRNLVQASQFTLQNIELQMANQEGIISQLPNNEKQLLNYQRKSTLYENLFNYLSQELAKTGIAKAEEIPDTKVLDPARMMGDGPIAPQEKLILALAFILGMIFPLGWIILYDSLDETINNIHELETFSKVPVLASIATDESKSSLSVAEIKEWKVEESFRDLTASIQFLIPDKTKNVIGITSTIPGEGKSFCAINLGIHFAKAGKRILLIDSDFRKPSHLEAIANEGKKDFAEFLLDEEIAAASIIHTHPDIPYLHLVMTSKEEDNPQIMLSSARYAELIEELKPQYDYIIIDSPAIGLVSDYLLISPLIAINLFVVRRKLSKLSFLKNLNKLTNSKTLEHVYLLFNGAVGKSFKYGYDRYEYGGRETARSGLGLKAIKNWLF